MEANQFVPIRVSTLRGDLKIPFDVYVRIAGKHILYCRKGDSFEDQRLQRLKEKKLKKLFILNNDEIKYRTYMQQNIDSSFDGSFGKPIEIRAQVIQGAQQSAAEDVMDNPESDAFYSVAKEGSRRYVEFLLMETHAIRSIMNIENTDHNIAHHGVNTATLAIGLSETLGLKDSHNLHLLALGCLIHDIELHYSNLNIARPLKEFSPAELELYRQHPYNGAVRVRDHQHFDQIVMNIILQHEETINGSGFPKGLRESEIEPMVLIASAANAFDRLVSFEGNQPKEALKQLFIQKMGLLPLGHLQSLQSTLKAKGIIG